MRSSQKIRPSFSHKNKHHDAGTMMEVTHQDGIAILRMTHGKANAMDTEFCDAITGQFEEHRQSSSQAIVLLGTGRIFSAGVDLLRLLDGGVPYIRTFLPKLCTAFASVFLHPKPVVAAVNGHAIAGGCVLACAADRRLMAHDTVRIGVTELLVGVVYPPVAMEIMRHALAPQYYEEAILSGTTYLPAEAQERALVHGIVEPVVLMERAVDAAKTLAALSPQSFAFTKQQMRKPAVERWTARPMAAAVEEIWTSPETLGRIRAYVKRTLAR
jgi:enoyl-CoA hydratase/carnithine racemase